MIEVDVDHGLPVAVRTAAAAEGGAAYVIDAHRMAVGEIGDELIAQAVDVRLVVGGLTLGGRCEAIAGGALQPLLEHVRAFGELSDPSLLAVLGDGIVPGLEGEGVGEPVQCLVDDAHVVAAPFGAEAGRCDVGAGDRKSTRLNSSHVSISYAV